MGEGRSLPYQWLLQLGFAVRVINLSNRAVASEQPRAIGLLGFLLSSESPLLRRALWGIGIFSGLINVLALTSSLYMLQLYDRVIPSHSVPTLVGITILMLVLYLAYGVLEAIRSKLMMRIGVELDRTYRDRVYRLVVALPLKTARGLDAYPIRDLDQIKSFLSGQGPLALFDFPWMPFYLGLVFLLHPWLGILALVGAILLVGVTILTDVKTRVPTREGAVHSAARSGFAEATRRNADVIAAMGMIGAFTQRWRRQSELQHRSQLRASDVSSSYVTLSKVLRYVLQSAVLGLGAYLTIEGQATGGVMIAASILTARALAPVEIAIANWRGFLSAQNSANQLAKLLDALPVAGDRLALPAPCRSLSVDSICVCPPGAQSLVLQNVTFRLEAGTAIGVIGPSASGKSTLARALVGSWDPVRGSVRLDGATIGQWPADTVGRHVGYLPQDIALFDGTVAENICRFERDAPSDAIVTAAKLASIHDMVVQLPDGYETRVGEAGTFLSAGQRQRVALARALYGEPFLVVLDEPNSNLDAEGDVALAQAIVSIKQRGGIAVVIAHRSSALAPVDQLLVLTQGQVRALGPKEEVLRQVTAPAPPAAGRSFKVVSEGVSERG